MASSSSAQTSHVRLLSRAHQTLRGGGGRVRVRASVRFLATASSPAASSVGREHVIPSPAASASEYNHPSALTKLCVDFHTAFERGGPPERLLNFFAPLLQMKDLLRPGECATILNHLAKEMTSKSKSSQMKNGSGGKMTPAVMNQYEELWSGIVRMMLQPTTSPAAQFSASASSTAGHYGIELCESVDVLATIANAFATAKKRDLSMMRAIAREVADRLEEFFALLDEQRQRNDASAARASRGATVVVKEKQDASSASGGGSHIFISARSTALLINAFGRLQVRQDAMLPLVARYVVECLIPLELTDHSQLRQEDHDLQLHGQEVNFCSPLCLNAIDVATMVNGFAKLDFYDEILFNRLPYERVLGSFEQTHLAMVANALGKVGFRDSVSSGSKKYRPDFSKNYLDASYMPSIVHALVMKLGQAENEDLRRACFLSLLRVDATKFEMCDLVLLLPCLPQLFPAAAGEVGALVSGGTRAAVGVPRTPSNPSDFTSTSSEPPSVAEAVTPLFLHAASEQNITAFKGQALATVAWAAARLRVEHWGFWKASLLQLAAQIRESSCSSRHAAAGGSVLDMQRFGTLLFHLSPRILTAGGPRDSAEQDEGEQVEGSRAAAALSGGSESAAEADGRGHVHFAVGEYIKALTKSLNRQDNDNNSTAPEWCAKSLSQAAIGVARFAPYFERSARVSVSRGFFDAVSAAIVSNGGIMLDVAVSAGVPAAGGVLGRTSPNKHQKQAMVNNVCKQDLAQLAAAYRKVDISDESVFRLIGNAFIRLTPILEPNAAAVEATNSNAAAAARGPNAASFDRQILDAFCALELSHPHPMLRDRIIERDLERKEESGSGGAGMLNPSKKAVEYGEDGTEKETDFEELEFDEKAL
eukprot:g4680.t1